MTHPFGLHLFAGWNLSDLSASSQLYILFILFVVPGLILFCIIRYILRKLPNQSEETNDVLSDINNIQDQTIKGRIISVEPAHTSANRTSIIVAALLVFFTPIGLFILLFFGQVLHFITSIFHPNPSW